MYDSKYEFDSKELIEKRKSELKQIVEEYDQREKNLLEATESDWKKIVENCQPEEKEIILRLLTKMSDRYKEKNTLLRLFENMFDYQKSKIDDIENHVREDIKAKFISNEENENFNIQTALVVRNEYDSNNSEFCPILSKDDEKKLLGAFFECSYKKFQELTTSDKLYKVKVTMQNGTVHEGDCKFTPSAAFLKAERNVLHKIAKEYHITRPLIFSPYARKFAAMTIYKRGYQKEIMFSSGKMSDPNIKSVCIDGLDCIKFTTDYRLVWNVLTDTREVGPSQEGLQNTIIPRWMEDRYRFNYCCRDIKNNEFLLAEVENEPGLIYLREKEKAEENGRVYIFSEESRYFNGNLFKYTLSKIISPDVTVFENYFAPNLFPVQRPRTKGDIMSILSCFKGNEPFNINIYLSDDDKGKISLYADDYRYYNFRKNADWLTFNVSAEKKYKCTLIFEGKDEILTEDYAQYVLDYISCMYPEINWQGKVKIKT